MEYGDLLTNFFGCDKKAGTCWRLWTITLGKCWIDKIDDAYNEGQLKHVTA
jgi:hypothetical protein